MASETTTATNTIRQNEHPYLKKRRKCIVLFIYFLIEKNLYLKSYLFSSKIGINALIRGGGGAYARRGLYEGGLPWSNTSVKEKVGLSAEGPIRGGVLIGGEIQYCVIG